MKVYNRVINKVWRSLPLPVTNIKLNNKKYKVPRFQYHHFYKDTYYSEQWIEHILASLNKLDKLNVCIDVGINIGQTFLKMKSVNSNIIYYGFEPNPFCCSVVEQLIALNNFTDCHIIPCGLSDKSQFAKLKLASQSDLLDSTASLIEGFRESKSGINQIVCLVDFDSVYQELDIDRIDLIKIDVEGGELEAIKGMTNALNFYQPIIIMEVLPSYSNDNHFRVDRQKALSDIIDSLDYNIYHITNKEIRPEYVQIKNFKIHDKISESDYLLCPKHININDF